MPHFLSRDYDPEGYRKLTYQWCSFLILMRMAFTCSKWAIRTGESHSFAQPLGANNMVTWNTGRNKASHAPFLAPNLSHDGFSWPASETQKPWGFLSFSACDLKHFVQLGTLFLSCLVFNMTMKQKEGKKCRKLW